MLFTRFLPLFSWDDPYIRSLIVPSCYTPIHHVKKLFEFATFVAQSVSHCSWYKYKLMFGISPARITWNCYTTYILQPIHPQDSIPEKTWADRTNELARAWKDAWMSTPCCACQHACEAVLVVGSIKYGLVVFSVLWSTAVLKVDIHSSVW